MFWNTGELGDPGEDEYEDVEISEYAGEFIVGVVWCEWLCVVVFVFVCVWLVVLCLFVVCFVCRFYHTVDVVSSVALRQEDTYIYTSTCAPRMVFCRCA